MKYKLVIFDWDGTIMDSVSRIVSCVKSTQQRAQLPISTDLAIKDIIGLSLDKALSVLSPDLSGDQLNHMIEIYREEYSEHDITPTPIFDQLESLLIELKGHGIKMAIATGKGRAGLNRVIEVSGLSHYFCDTVCASEAKSKPDPQMIDLLIDRVGIPRSGVVMIGDSTLDMFMAQQAGIDAIGVTYGAHSREVLAQHSPIAIVDSADALLEHLMV